MSKRRYVIRDIAAVRLLASPLRQAILDFIVASGPTTVAELSARFARPADRLYYHVRLLLRAGLLVPMRTTGDVGRSGAQFDVPGRPMVLEYAAGSAHRRALTRVADALLRTARRDFAREAHQAANRVDGARRELWAGRTEALLEPEEIEALNTHLTGIINLMGRTHGRPSSRAREFQFSWVLSPAARSSAGRSRGKAN